MNKETFDKIVPRPPLIGQSRGPIFWMLNKLEAIKPIHTIIETGVGPGGSSQMWTNLVDKGDLVIEVDINPDLNRINWDYKNSDRNLHFVIGSSYEDETVEQVRKILNGKKADFLFIDGDHSYRGVSQDFIKYSPFVRKGGIVGFHDIDMTAINLPDNLNGLKTFFVGLKGVKETTRSWMRPKSNVVNISDGINEFGEAFMSDMIEIVKEDNPKDDIICTGLWYKEN